MSKVTNTDEFYRRMLELRSEHPKWRRGQVAFNLMYVLYPKIANKYRGTELDPFHNDSKTDKFIYECLKEVEDE